MLSRPSEKRVVARTPPAAKACSPRGTRMQSRPGEHAFAASMSKQLDSSLEGRESMAPTVTLHGIKCSHHAPRDGFLTRSVRTTLSFEGLLSRKAAEAPIT